MAINEVHSERQGDFVLTQVRVSYPVASAVVLWGAECVYPPCEDKDVADLVSEAEARQAIAEHIHVFDILSEGTDT